MLQNQLILYVLLAEEPVNNRKWTECIGLYQTESYLYCPSIRTCSVLIRDDVHVLLVLHVLRCIPRENR